ncbi:hypothetical protein CALVIDRAFT_594414 [Calocera viscosa TUFC12733]|uniref:EXPERA domain-containing protein n=1 Tax=Calocera viscosa (strain TUFC12733) TaxID=1330018 RepID=A0A167SA11_CALVF|nr:hypothetical protein CALVIDRAFT_594414 [Calocera viscosa TUFC12733]
MAHTPLYKRPVDLIYFTWFLVNIPITLCIDMQHVYPKHLVPEQLKNVMVDYMERSSDPVTLGAFGLIGNPGQYTWCIVALYLEFFLQLPIFFIGLWGLWKASARINILILIYGVSTATIVLACVATILAVPTTSDLTINAGIASVTDEQRALLLKCYLPYLIVPTVMTLDMGWRMLKLVDAGLKATKKRDLKSR